MSLLSQQPPPHDSRPRWWTPRCRRWQAYVLAVVAPLATLAGRLALQFWVGTDRPVLVVFLIPIILSAYIGGMGPGLLATLVIALGTWYFLIPPIHSFQFNRPVDLAQWTILIGTGVVISVVNEALHRSRQRAETAARELQRLNQLYATLSQINQRLVPVRSREELFAEVCRITAACAGFKAVWVGWRDPATQAVAPVGRAGESAGYLDAITVFADERPAGQGPVGRCIRSNQPCVVNDFAADPRLAMSHAAAAAHGLNAVAALPIHLRGAVCGALVVYAGQVNFFRDKEVALLAEAAAAISLGLDKLEHDAALQASEQRFQKMATCIDDVLYGVDGVTAEFNYVSPAFLRLLGYTLDDVRQMGGREMFLGTVIQEGKFAEQQQVFRQLQLRQITEVGHRWEAWWQCQDGTRKYVEDHWFPVFDGERLTTTFGVLRDITERKQAETALATQRTLLRTLIDRLPDLVFTKDRATRVTLCNAAAAQYLGVTEAAMLGKTVFDVNPPELARQYHADDLRVLEQGEIIIDREELIRRCDGQERWHLTTKAPLRDPAGQITGLVVVCHDIHDRKQAMDTLWESEARFRELFESSPDAVFVENSTGCVLDANPAACRLHGMPRDQLVGRSVLELVPPDQRAAVAAMFQKWFTGELTCLEGVTRANDGRDVPVEIRGAAITYQRQPAVLLHVRDITARKLAEAALQASLREKEVLLKEIHHRVKNNLQLISSLLHLQELQQAGPVGEALRDTQTRIRSMALLHETLYRSGQMAWLNLPQYLESLVSYLRRTLANTAAVQIRVTTTTVRLDIEQAVPCGLIINELVTNSLKHAFPDGRAGEILVELQPVADGRLQLRVADNGVGLPAGLDWEHCLSLGLLLVKDLARQIGGVVAVESAAGTSVRITFTATYSS